MVASLFAVWLLSRPILKQNFLRLSALRAAAGHRPALRGNTRLRLKGPSRQRGAFAQGGVFPGLGRLVADQGLMDDFE